VPSRLRWRMRLIIIPVTCLPVLPGVKGRIPAERGEVPNTAEDSRERPRGAGFRVRDDVQQRAELQPKGSLAEPLFGPRR
jgi:hypothetical protein